MSSTPPQAQGKAAGLLTSAISAGQFLSPLVSGPIADSFGLPTVYLGAAAMLAIVATLLLVASGMTSAARQ
jgi:MFS family permease